MNKEYEKYKKQPTTNKSKDEIISAVIDCIESLMPSCGHCESITYAYVYEDWGMNASYFERDDFIGDLREKLQEKL